MSINIKANIISGNTIKANVEAGGNIRVNAVTGSVKSVTSPDVVIKAFIKDQGPIGPTGPSNTLTIGTVEGGETAAATITGTAPNQTLNLTLPKGDKGDTGNKGDPGVGINEQTVGFTITGGTTPKTLTVALDASVSGSNTGDQTLPVKANGAELDTATDDTKFATAKAIKDSHNVPSVIPGNSGNLLTSNGTDWTSSAPPVSVSVTTKGDLQTYSTTPDRLPVGTNGQLLESRSTETTGLKWIDPPSSTDLNITAAPASDHLASGMKIVLTAGANMAFGDVGYIASTGKVALIDADAIASMTGVVMCADASISVDASGNYLLIGIARDDTWNWTVGGIIYGTVTGTTGNTLSQTAPTGTDDVVQIMGVATHADRMYFNPQLVQIERL